MKDRVSTKILDNGATRYGVYDETGNLLRYEYIKLEDEPTVEGDLFSKANMLPDSIPAALGLKMVNPQVKDALNVLANIGNVHVWSRTIKIAADVPATYYLDVAAQLSVGVPPAGTGISRSVTYSESVSVADDGTVALSGTPTTATLYFSMGQPAPSEILGKYFLLDSAVYFCPADATCISNGHATPSVMLVSPQRVIGVPMIPAGTHTDYLTSTDRNAYTDGTVDNTTITYLGQLGGGARIKVGSYVGTGTYGKTNPNSLTFDFVPKVVMLLFISAPVYGQNFAPTISSLFQGSAYNPVMVTSMLTTSPQANVGFMYNSTGGTYTYDYAWTSPDKCTIYWYNTRGSTQQFNGLAYNSIPNTYHYVAIG